MAIVKLGATRRIALDKLGTTPLVLGGGSASEASHFLVQIVNTGSVNTLHPSIVVKGRINTVEAEADSVAYAPILYRPLFLNNAVGAAGAGLVSTAIAGDGSTTDPSSILIIPANGLSIALDQTYTSGTGFAYVTPLVNSSVI